MKKNYTFITLFFCFFLSLAQLNAEEKQELSVLWGLELPQNLTTDSHGASVATDEDGNLYAVGCILDDAYLDYFPTANEILGKNSAGAYLIKYTTAENKGIKDGMSLWSRRIGPEENSRMRCEARIVLVNNLEKCVYVIGDYVGANLSADKEAGSELDNKLPYNGNSRPRDMFIASYTLDGEFKAVKTTLGYNLGKEKTAPVPTGAIITIENGVPKLFIAGNLPNYGGHAGKGNDDGFVVKIDAKTFELEWINSFGGETDFESFYDLANDKNGDIYVVGGTKSKDPLKYSVNGEEKTFIPQGTPNDSYILKLKKEDGTIEWLKGITGVGDKQIKSIAFDKNDDFYLTGSIDAEAVEFQASKPIAVKGLFISKHKKDASCIWVNTFGNTSNRNIGSAIAFGKADKVYLGGSFCRKIEANGITLEKESGDERWSPQIFVGQLDGKDGALKQVIYLDGNKTTGQTNSLATFGDELYFTGTVVNFNMADQDTLTVGDREIRFPRYTAYPLIVAFTDPTVTPDPAVTPDPEVVTALNPATEESVKVEVGPNPFSNLITVSAEGEFKVRLYNLLGQELMPMSVANGTTVLQLSNLTAGIYLLNVETSKGMTSTRLIKK